MYLGKNIRTIREFWGLNQKEFGLLIGATRGMVMQYENRGTMPKKETVSRIVSVTGFTDDILINTEIKREDIEPMSQENALFIENYRENPDDYELNDAPIPSFLEKRRNQKLHSDHNETEQTEGVPIYDVPIDASFLERYREEEFQPLYYLNIPRLRNCNFGAIISGSSMYPIMKSGSIALCRIVEDLNYIDPGEMYLISTTNGFETVKYVQMGEKKDELKLIPHNEKIMPTSIKKNMIIRICIVEAWLNFR